MRTLSRIQSGGCRAGRREDAVVESQRHARGRTQDRAGTREHERRVERLVQLPPAGHGVCAQAGAARAATPGSRASGSRSPLTTYFPPCRPRRDHDDAGLGAERVEIARSSGLVPARRTTSHTSAATSTTRGNHPHEPRTPLLRRAGTARAGTPRASDGPPRSGAVSPVKSRERVTEVRVHALDRFLQHRSAARPARCPRMTAAMIAYGPCSIQTERSPTCSVSSPSLVGDAERVAGEVADRRQHARHHVGVLNRRPVRDVLQQQPDSPVDQEHLLDAVDERVEQDDLGEGLARPKRRDPPLAPRATRGCARACGSATRASR